MTTGFIYVLLNPAFPHMVKIGRSSRQTRIRSKELSSATGVPLDFLVLYDVLVSDVETVESVLHRRFENQRVKRQKEFFYISPKQAITALVELADKFRVDAATIRFADDLLPMLRGKFPGMIDPAIFSVRLVTVPGTCYLRIGRKVDGGEAFSDEDLPLDGLRYPDPVLPADLEHNARELMQLDDYDWIMISDVFPRVVAEEVAREWERPGGKLQAIHQRTAR
jgi:T5orf172 domain